MNIGVFGCDPGGHTGLAWGIFDHRAKGGVAEALQTRMNAGSATVTGDERQQIREVTEIWRSFYSACVRSALLPPDHVWLVFEDFIMRPGQTAGGRDSTIPLALIWGIEGYRMGRADEWSENNRGPLHVPSLVLQTAGQASSFATAERLKEWDLWVRGREHERSAWKHVALFVQRYMNQHSA